MLPDLPLPRDPPPSYTVLPDLPERQDTPSSDPLVPCSSAGVLLPDLNSLSSSGNLATLSSTSDLAPTLRAPEDNEPLPSVVPPSNERSLRRQSSKTLNVRVRKGKEREDVPEAGSSATPLIAPSEIDALTHFGLGIPSGSETAAGARARMNDGLVKLSTVLMQQERTVSSETSSIRERVRDLANVSSQLTSSAETHAAECRSAIQECRETLEARLTELASSTKLTAAPHPAFELVRDEAFRQLYQAVKSDQAELATLNSTVKVLLSEVRSLKSMATSAPNTQPAYNTPMPISHTSATASHLPGPSTSLVPMKRSYPDDEDRVTTDILMSPVDTTIHPIEAGKRALRSISMDWSNATTAFRTSNGDGIVIRFSSVTNANVFFEGFRANRPAGWRAECFKIPVTQKPRTGMGNSTGRGQGGSTWDIAPAVDLAPRTGAHSTPMFTGNSPTWASQNNLGW